MESSKIESVDEIDFFVKREEAQHIIDSIYEKYKSNPYMFSRTHNYICNQLPNILVNFQNNHIERLNRIEELSQDQDNFVQTFLNNHRYFYSTSTEKFFYYDELHYHLYNEDDILYNVLSSISRDGQLMSWKQRTKIHIMKKIRENPITKSIPESETIQLVLDSLYPTLFSKRCEAKHFLTMIGDNILKKNSSFIYFISPKSKMFIRELNNVCQSLIGANLSNTIKHKYHEHSYESCRLIKINDCVKNDSVWNPILNTYALDLICVACHYSIRYNNADDYIINSSNDLELKSNVFFIKDIQPNDLVNSFISQYLDINYNPISSQSISIDGQHAHRTTQITWKNMQYLWRTFLDSNNLPTIIFMQTLKGMLVEKLSDYYNQQADSFLGICSKFLPSIQKFLQFWNETMLPDETETDLEIEEVIILFRRWCKSKNENESTLNDIQVLDIILYFFPQIEIERHKYISKIRCSLWDKQLDIEVALENMKEGVRNKHTHSSMRNNIPQPNWNISIYDAYLFYCKYHSSTRFPNQIVSKSYFEKYVFDNLSDFIVDSTFLSFQWWTIH